MNGADLFDLILAVVLGGIIGAEREFNKKPAGLRTNILICLGAAVFTIISRRIVAGEPAGTAARVAAQIVTGVGFLGAGAIIQDRGGVHGLTTAATIWLVASIGTACGAGLRELAVISTAVAVAVLFGLSPVARLLANLRGKYSAAGENRSNNSEQEKQGHRS